MAWTFVLLTESGTDSVDLNDGTFFHVATGGFAAPPPPRSASYSGGNLQRHGEDLLARTWGNRTVSVGLTVKATDASTLGKKVGDVWGLLRMAEEWSKDGLGTQVQLRYQWEGQTGTYLFNVIEGNLDLGADLHGPYLLKGTRIHNARLDLVCEPFVTQPSETLQNWLKDPSFEVAGSALVDWGVNQATATRTRVTSNAKYGTAALQVVKATAAGTNLADSFQRFTSPGTAAFSASVWGTLSGGGTARLLLEWQDSAGAQVGSNEASSTAGTFQVTIANASVPASAGTGTLIYILRQVVTSGSTGTVYWDGGYLTTATALPKAWVSGRDVANHFDDNGQAHINYLDVYDVPGDVPASVQIRVNENEAHDEVWMGARHAGRLGATAVIIEGESFTSTIGLGSWGGSADSTASNGSFGTFGSAGTTWGGTSAVAPAVIMATLTSPPFGQFRVLARAQHLSSGTGVYIGFGYQYGGITVDPSTTAHYIGMPATATVWRLHDLGILSIPPLQTPVSGSVGTFGVRIAFYVDPGSWNQHREILDYIMLIPLDQGGLYGSKISAADNLWVDSVTEPAGLYRITTAGVAQSFPPGQQGSPPSVHPKGSRFYFAFGSATGSIGHGATVSISYSPRFLQVGT